LRTDRGHIAEGLPQPGRAVRVERWDRPQVELADLHPGERRVVPVELKPDARRIVVVEMKP
ncbi:hypothetical protein ACIRST_40020, partial [Kitasatospora sp. NPDC101447]|uniref:hypothetical protein n=1 Tax=Kitasatospora sp. NPDC101447 TaxID=3364102 RepID=UPI0038164F01